MLLLTSSTTLIPVQVSATGCGTTKGCFRYPTDCTGGSDCEFFVSWTSDDNGNNVFTMTGSNAATYVALGFSKSGQMVRFTKGMIPTGDGFVQYV